MTSTTPRDSSPTPIEISQESLDASSDSRALQPPAPTAPGDEVTPDSPGSAQGLCPACGGSGMAKGQPCANCGGAGKVAVGVGGG